MELIREWAVIIHRTYDKLPVLQTIPWAFLNN